MLVVLINEKRKCFIACSVSIPTVFTCDMRLRAAWRYVPEVSIYGQICIKPTWRQTRLACPIMTTVRLRRCEFSSAELPIKLSFIFRCFSLASVP